MKKFFKCLAVLLALTLVIGTIPAAAADEVTPTTRTTKTLFIGGAKGSITAADGTVKKSTIKSSFRMANLFKNYDAETQYIRIGLEEGSDVLKKSEKKDKIYAKAIGTEKVTAVVYDRATDEKLADTEITVTVNKNAEACPISGIEDGAKFDAGTKQTIVLSRKVDGVQVDTDKRQLIINGKKAEEAEGVVVTANKYGTSYEVTFEEGGEYTISGYAYQSKTATDATAKSAEIKVTVVSTWNVEQVNVTTFAINFNSAKEAAQAEESTNKMLKNAAAPVTEDDIIVKVWELGKNGEEISAFIKETKAEGSKLNVTMMQEIAEDQWYKVAYGNGKNDIETKFQGCKWIPNEIVGKQLSFTANDGIDGGSATLGYTVYAKGANGEARVEITDKAKLVGVNEFKDLATVADYSKYNMYGDEVVFFVNGITVQATANFTFFVEGKVDPQIIVSEPFDVTTKDSTKITLVNYDVVSVFDTANMWKPATGNSATFFCSDEQAELRVAILIDNDGNGVKDDGVDYIEYEYGDNADITFKSGNIDKLSIAEDNGIIFSNKETNATVNVYVYYKGELAGVAQVKVVSERVFTTLSIDKPSQNISYSQFVDGEYLFGGAENPDYAVRYALPDSFAQWTIKALDQAGQVFPDVVITIEKITNVLDGNIAGDLNVVDEKSDSPIAVPMGEFAVTAAAAHWMPSKSIQTASWKITAESNKTDATGKPVTTKVQNISMTVKCVDNTTPIVSKKFVDVATSGTAVYGYDNAGYAVCGYYLDRDWVEDGVIYRAADPELVKVDMVNNARPTERLDWYLDDEGLGYKYVVFYNEDYGVNRQITKLPYTHELINSNEDVMDALRFEETNIYQVIGSYSYVAYSFNPSIGTNGSWRLAFKDVRNFVDPAPSIDWTWINAYGNWIGVMDPEYLLDNSFKWNSSWYDRYRATLTADVAGYQANDGSFDTAWNNTKLVPESFAYVYDDGYDWDCSYVENPDGSTTFLYFYIVIGGHVWQTRINRTVYNNKDFQF